MIVPGRTKYFFWYTACDADGVKMSSGRTIGFIPLYDIHTASSRYRVFQFFPSLSKAGYVCRYLSPPLNNNIKRLAYIPQLIHLAQTCDVLYLQKRILPGWLLKIVIRINPRLIYDFDDAVYLLPNQSTQLQETLRVSRLVVTGNDHLAAYAKNHSQNIVVIPTVVDTSVEKPLSGVRHPADPRTYVGWIGSDPNRGDLETIRPILSRLDSSYPNNLLLVIIGSHPYSGILSIPQLFVPWTLETYLEQLQQLDIGIMPLEDNAWNRGKCAFKLIQYLAVGVPAIASPIGMNTALVIDGKTGYLASSSEDWYDRLSLLINSIETRTKLSSQGRAHIQENYSLLAIFPKILDCINEVANS